MWDVTPAVSASSSPSLPSISLHNIVLPTVSSSSFPSYAPASLPPMSPSVTSQPQSVLNSITQSPFPMDPDFQPEHMYVVLPLSPMNLHPMTTRSKNGISKRKAYFATVQFIALSQVEPRSLKAASTIVEWQLAMQEEIEALLAQGTWDLISLPPAKNLVGCKWVYRIKKNVD